MSTISGCMINKSSSSKNLQFYILLVTLYRNLLEGWFAAPLIHAASEPHILNAYFMTELHNTERKGGEYKSCSFSGSIAVVCGLISWWKPPFSTWLTPMQHLAGVAQHNSVLCEKCGDPLLVADAADSKGRGEREGQAWPFTLTLRTDSLECSNGI